MELIAPASPADFSEIRKLQKRPWGGPLKASKCFCCGSGLRISNHHIEPRDAGGSDSPKNKVTLCDNCHNAVEGLAWKDILARREQIRTERYAEVNQRHKEGEDGWRIGKWPTLAERRALEKDEEARIDAEQKKDRAVLEKIASIRRYCLTKGVLQNDGYSEDFRQAFRTLNQTYVVAKSEYDRKYRLIVPQSEADLIRYGEEIVFGPGPLRSKVDRLLFEGTQEEWVKAIVEFATSDEPLAGTRRIPRSYAQKCVLDAAITPEMASTVQ
jgi:HNH endonuclease